MGDLAQCLTHIKRPRGFSYNEKQSNKTSTCLSWIAKEKL